MDFLYIYEAVNVIMIASIIILAKVLFENLEHGSNKHLLVGVIGLCINLLGVFSMAYTSDVNATLVCLRIALVGEFVLGIGYVGYMVRFYHAVHYRLLQGFWAFTLIGTFYHTIGLDSSNVFIKNATVVYSKNMFILTGDKGAVFYMYVFANCLIELWGIALIIADTAMNPSKKNKILRINATVYLTAIILRGAGFLISVYNFGKIPDLTPLFTALATGLYATASIKYGFMDYEKITHENLLENLDAGLIISTLDNRPIYANARARELYPNINAVGADGDQYSKEIEEIVIKREFEMENHGRTYRVSADRIFVRNVLRGYSILLYDVTDLLDYRARINEGAQRKEKLLVDISHEIRTPLNIISASINTVEYKGNNVAKYEEVKDTINVAITNIDDILTDLLSSFKDSYRKDLYKNQHYAVDVMLNNVINKCNERVNRKKVKFKVVMRHDVPLDAVGDDMRVMRILISVLSNAIRYTDNGNVTFTIGGHPLGDGRFEYEYEILDERENYKNSEDETEKDIDISVENGSDFCNGVGLSLTVAKRMVNMMDGDLSITKKKGNTIIYVHYPSEVDTENTLNRVKNPDMFRPSFYGDISLFADLKTHCIENGVTVKEYSNIQRLKKDSEEMDEFLIFDYEKYGKRILQSVNAAPFIKVAVLPYGVIPKEAGSDWIFINPPISALSIQHIFKEYKSIKKGEKNTAFFVAPKAKVLMVDDNGMNLRMAAAILERFEIKPELACSGFEAVNRVRSGDTFDIIFMDYMMESINGIEATRQIREITEDRRIPIIAFTANSVDGAREMYIEGGMDDCLFKPATYGDFALILRKYLPGMLIEERGLKDKSFSESMDDLPKVEGIDYEAALNYCGGNVAVYKEMLASLTNEIDSHEQKLIEYREKEDIKNFIVEAHGIKSVARSLGISNIASILYKLEMAGKDENIEEIDRLMPTAMEALQNFKDVFRPFAEERERQKIKIVPKNSIDETLVKINEFLEEFELKRAEELARTLSKDDFNEGAREDFEGLMAGIDHIDYYEAKEYIERLISKI